MARKLLGMLCLWLLVAATLVSGGQALSALATADISAQDKTSFLDDLALPGAMVMELTTDTVLLERNADVARSVTGFSAWVAALYAIDNGYADDGVFVDAGAADKKDAEGVQFSSGERQPMWALLGAAIKGSTNAEHAAAVHMGGTTERFVALMNAYVADLGMEVSRFSYAEDAGFSADTTPRDMYKLTRALLANERMRQLAFEPEVTLTLGGVAKTLAQQVELMNSFSTYYDPRARGLMLSKDSNTGTSGLVYAVEGDMQVVAISLGDFRAVETECPHKLIQYAFSHYGVLDITDKDLPYGGWVDVTVGDEVRGGVARVEQPIRQLTTAETVTRVRENGELRFGAPEALPSPAVGQPIAMVPLMLGELALSQLPVYPADGPRPSFEPVITPAPTNSVSAGAYDAVLQTVDFLRQHMWLTLAALGAFVLLVVGLMIFSHIRAVKRRRKKRGRPNNNARRKRR